MTGTRFRMVSPLLAVAAVASCATSPAQPYYASPVKDVGEDMWSYWRQVPPEVGTHFQPPDKSGCAAVEITIDSNGNVWDPKVLRFIGPLGFDASVQRYLLSFHFKPSAHNTAKIPVRAAFSVAFASHTSRAGVSLSEVKASAATQAASQQSCLTDLKAEGIKS